MNMANNAQIGDMVKITTDDSVFEGLIMPNENKENLVLKLKSGYNIGIEKNKIKNIDILENAPDKPTTQKIKQLPKKQNLPTIFILHTGGTIASKVDYKTGAVTSRFEPEELIGMFPELKEIANIESELITNILSENLALKHIEKFAEAIIKQIGRNKDLKGIILTHGTDIMTYTSAALGFMLQGIKIPVIIVGAQRSSDRGSSDAAMNLICAAEFIRQTDFTGIAICMHETSEDENCLILPAYKTRKMHSSRRDAFRPINEKAIARINFRKREVEWIKRTEKNEEENKFEPKIKLNDSVGIIKAYPSMNPKIFDAFQGYKGLIIEGTALGHAPIMEIDEYTKRNTEIKNALKKIIDSGTLVFMASQSIYGSVQMHVYSCGVELMNLGVNPAKMLAETAYMKLSWLLGNFWKSKEDNKKIVELMQSNIDGELFDRIEEDTFLI